MIRRLLNGNRHQTVCTAHAPKPLLLQWHITERCNLRCAHCYDSKQRSPELDLAALIDILEEFKALQEGLKRESGISMHAQVTVTGGEPFLREDFFDLLEVIHKEKPRISFAILSNGTLIDRVTARRLRTLHPRFVQVSVEGGRDTHDAIRGTGNHAITVRAIRELVSAGVPVLVSFTAHRMNYREFPEVAKLCCDLGVRRVWADRIIPIGAGSDLGVLSPEETHEFINLIRDARERARRRWFCRTEVAMHRALQFLEGGHPYRCSAGDTLISVLANGDVYPCRRMPILIGNLRQTPLIDLYRTPMMQQLRNSSCIPAACVTCAHAKECGGALRCLSHAVTGSPFERDPGCWVT